VFNENSELRALLHVERAFYKLSTKQKNSGTPPGHPTLRRSRRT